MELTLDLVKRLRDEGLSWRQIGLFLADEIAEEPYILQERARSMYRRNFQEEPKHTILRKSIKTNKDQSAVSEITLMGAQWNQYDGDALLKAHGYDPRYWRVVESTCAKRGDVWSSRVKVVAREVPQLDGEELASHLEEAVNRLDAPVSYRDTDGVKLAVVALYDIHYGRRGVDGDYRRTESEVKSVVTQLVRRLTEESVKKVVMTIGQDFLNSDNIQGATTSGTPQDMSMSWYDMFSGGLALAIWVIDALNEVAPVSVLYNEGNHDRVFSYAIVKALEQRYEHCAGVEIDSDTSPRKYMLFGKNLIGFSHGKDEANLSTVMQMEEPVRWGSSLHRYWFLGHLHHLEMMEKDGVTIIRCPSLAFEDEWTRRKGFVGSDRSLLCGIFTQDGLENIWLMRP